MDLDLFERQAPVTLVKLEELNAASRLGYDAGRALRDIALDREASLDPAIAFIKRAIDEIRAVYSTVDSRKPTAYEPQEVVRRFIGVFEKEDQKVLVITPAQTLGELSHALQILEGAKAGELKLPPETLMEIYYQISPLQEAYLDLAGDTAEELTAI